MLPLLLVAAAVGPVLAGANSVPSLEEPTGRSLNLEYVGGNVPVAQFYSGPSDSLLYNWGYHYPGQSHSERKTRTGVVSGNYEFVDANGVRQHTQYSAAPGVGYTATGTLQAQPPTPQLQPGAPQYQAPGLFRDLLQAADLSGPSAQRLLAQYAQTGLALDVGSRQAVERSSPQLLAAVRSGLLEPLRGSQTELVFKVADSLVDQTRGSVSALASVLDTDVAAARHDAQVPRTPDAAFYSAPQQAETRAILEPEYLPGGPRYVVRVPYQ